MMLYVSCGPAKPDWDSEVGTYLMLQLVLVNFTDHLGFSIFFASWTIQRHSEARGSLKMAAPFWVKWLT